MVAVEDLQTTEILVWEEQAVAAMEPNQLLQLQEQALQIQAVAVVEKMELMELVLEAMVVQV